MGSGTQVPELPVNLSDNRHGLVKKYSIGLKKKKRRNKRCACTGDLVFEIQRCIIKNVLSATVHPVRQGAKDFLMAAVGNLDPESTTKRLLHSIHFELFGLSRRNGKKKPEVNRKLMAP